jgi:hypothetical protein
LRKKLHGIHSKTTRVWIGQVVNIKETLEDYMAAPSDSDSWKVILDAIEGTRGEVMAILSELKSDSKDLSTLPFYSELLLTLAERERILSKVRTIKEPPKSPPELEAVKVFLDRYSKLIEELGNLNTEIAKFIERLRQDGKWPIRGD